MIASLLYASVEGDLGDALSRFTSVLAVPVVVGAGVVLVLAAIELGRWAGELTRRRRASGPLSLLTRQVLHDPSMAPRIAAGAPSLYAETTLRTIGAAVAAGDLEGVEYALDDFEHLVERRLDRTRMIVRAGPAIGLMGTLIPLAPGLRALGRGDIHLLADDLRIAFAATTVGLLAGTVAFALTLVRTRRWNEDLASMERATERVRAAAAAAATARARTDADALLEGHGEELLA
ncbi:MAG TPA: MotA/TolQ/ExbB proton channel family protein [Baekduia sp.]|uniref:MotA/TolQ/ExbB proton channel family protein n=1 Tax=Baekduia sp. TaxID=2600305 RepID=UPI002D77F649|nr:MotA/TolQ/ExbB proton channel family protein [Baekduia sp.]HET6508065.1 MotA/TolQ/ExbB proton channel family protein [Baekduia sp.]